MPDHQRHLPGRSPDDVAARVAAILAAAERDARETIEAAHRSRWSTDAQATPVNRRGTAEAVPVGELYARDGSEAHVAAAAGEPDARAGGRPTGGEEPHARAGGRATDGEPDARAGGRLTGGEERDASAGGRLTGGEEPHAVAALAGRVSWLARRIDAIEAALQAGTRRADAPSETHPSEAFGAWERAKSPDGARSRNGARAERMRVVDLAVRGRSRRQIAAELRATMGELEVETLLDEVLERA